MTNLFYPALAVYLQKKFPPLHPPAPPSHNTHRHPFFNQGRRRKEHPLSLLSTPILDSFFPYPPPLLPRLAWAGWWGKDTGPEEGWMMTRSDGDEGDVRLIRVAWADVGEVLDGDSTEAEKKWVERDHLLLTLVRDTVEGWEGEYPSTGEGCVQQEGSCYLISPHDHPPEPGLTTFNQLAVADDAPEDDHAIPIGWNANAGNIYYSIAVPMRVPKRSDFTIRWSVAMQKIAERLGGEAFVEAIGPRDAEGDQTGDWLLSVCFEQLTADRSTANINRT
jgi:hypothetical protein